VREIVWAAVIAFVAAAVLAVWSIVDLSRPAGIAAPTTSAPTTSSTSTTQPATTTT
jgi:hypothetical protein